MDKNSHSRILKGKPKEQHLNSVLAFKIYIYIYILYLSLAFIYIYIYFKSTL